MTLSWTGQLKKLDSEHDPEEGKRMKLTLWTVFYV